MTITASDGITSTLTPDATAAGGESIPPGDTVLAQFTGLTDVCPEGADIYHVALNISYTNFITGLNHNTTGRIWGPCDL